MASDTRRWLEGEGEAFLRRVGVKEDQSVLDFGCGTGNYAVPAAKIVGEEGRVYALDQNERVLSRVRPKAEASGLQNIEIIRTGGEFGTGFEDASMDVVLLYDVLYSHTFPGSAGERKRLLGGRYRLLRPEGLLSVYPMHGDPGEVREEAEGRGFRLEEEYTATVIGFIGSLEAGRILNFRKKQRP